MAKGEEKKDDSRMYVVSGLFFICILAGGVFLGLYITLPETTFTIWYAIVGMVLVGIPWAFWFLICMYRCCTYPVPVNERRLSSKKNAEQIEVVAAAGTSSTATGTSGSPVDSPGGRHVRFGAATVVGRANSNREDIDEAMETESENSHDGQEAQHGAGASPSSTCDSEQPLAFSI